MEQSKLFNLLKNPKIYGSDVESVNCIQTHISYVFLTGKYAYKIKKAVNFGFLDFSTVEKRKFFCNEELKLNKRLCPEIYLEVVKITSDNGKISINGKGKIIDYALKMKEFCQENIMSNLLKNNEIDEEIIKKICRILVDFYNSVNKTKEIDKFGSVEIIKNNTDENFEQTENVIDVTISKDIFNEIKKNTNDFISSQEKLFENRIEEGYIKDCHGDLHSGNIVVNNGDICIFDCIEFNKRFRYSDIASDISYLAMDLDFLGFPYLSSLLIDEYIKTKKDYDVLKILNFYKCYRAYIRGKVLGFQLDDPNTSEDQIKTIKNTAAKYFDLADYYSLLFAQFLNGGNKPFLFLTCGLTGTGKTTIARKFSIDYNAKIISTDEVRKEIAGIDKYERHHDEYNTGLYSPEKMKLTYEKVFEKAETDLKKGSRVILDGTFKNRNLRDKAKELSDTLEADFLILFCNCPEKQVKNYLNQRVKKKSISDGRWEIYTKQKETFEFPSSREEFIEIDISNKKFHYQIKVFKEILRKIDSGVK